MSRETVSNAQNERRRCARNRAPANLRSVVLWTGPHPGPSQVYNLSRGGLAVLLDDPIEPGTVLRVGLLNGSGNFWHLKVMRVVHTTPLAEGQWVVGSRFLTRLTEKELQGLLRAEPSPPSPGGSSP
jgi:hypothetical protein